MAFASLSRLMVRVSLFQFVLWMSIYPALRSQAVQAQEPAQSSTAREIISMLNRFMDDATHNNAPGFDRFFADDVIYTRSAGVVITKADIMKSLSNAKPSATPSSIYSAEDVTVHEYPGMAVVAFRLVSRTPHTDGPAEISTYRNTGIFLLRSNKWQVVAWQSTKIPEPTTPK